MHIAEARRTRHLIVQLDRGEELPAALLRALGEAEARTGWVDGVGSLEAAEIASLDPDASRPKTRRIETPSALVSLSGNVAMLGGAPHVRLWAVLGRETEIGLEQCAGQLVWARAFRVELRVTVFDDVDLARTADEDAADAAGSTLAEPPVAAARGATRPAPAVSPMTSGEMRPAILPMRPTRDTRDEPEAYPEVGDAVTHFHFGSCTIIDSDGERIRMRQDRDGRVREVSLTMLRIDPPTVDAQGRRHFELRRKN